ncbi:MAG: chorismate synthase [Eubacterium sp.]|nr:chorismate synthase [Eubacterium sp.]
MSSIIGNNIRLSVFGESHSQGIGCVIDGLPAGIKLDFDRINSEMARRAPGKDKTSTQRKEADIPQILSGVLDGITTGAPLAVLIKNTNTKSSDYKNLEFIPRPSHSDYPAFVKYGGNNDIRGGGHFSARLTAPIVFAGAIAKQLLAEKGIAIGAHIKRISAVCDDCFDYNNISSELLSSLSSKNFSVIDESAEEKMRAEIEKYRLDGNSVGGEIECAATGLPVGIGANIFDTVESKISSFVFGVPAVKGIQFGMGFDFAKQNGAAVNDGYEIRNGRVCLLSNNNGGILGGMTSGAPIVFSVAMKPTPSISTPQKSVNLKTMQNEELVIKGRHDPCVAVRAVPVIEAAAALAILDLMM